MYSAVRYSNRLLLWGIACNIEDIARMTIHTLRLPRETCCLGSLHTAIPRNARILIVRYTQTEMVAIYRL
jgi:hypothetical protein